MKMLMEVVDAVNAAYITKISKSEIWKKIQTHKRFKRTLFPGTRQSQPIFGIIPFVKLQNDS